MNDILDGYARAATGNLIAAYDGLSSQAIFWPVIDLLPGRRAKVADIGAGTGRDAAWFADKGHEVLAVEPVRELREAGQMLHPSTNIRWLDSRLPELDALPPAATFDLVTVCAVWQHLTDAARHSAMRRLATITAPSGMLVMSLRHGPGAVDREVFPVAPDSTIDMATICGLRLVRRQNSPSIQPVNRLSGVSWTWLAFQKLH